jgi:murein tripeptide amidase MpaA
MILDSYITNDELEQLLKQWTQEYPELVSVEPLGKSYEQRPIWLVTLTNRSTGVHSSKPAMWIDANIHATEITGTTTALNIIHGLLSGHPHDTRSARILDTTTLYIVPRLNPDGAALAMDANPRYLRSGVRPYPWQEKEDGLHPLDIDKDGRVLQMRIPDPAGDWKVSSLDPRLLEKRPPDEFGGHYYRLMTEGLLENYDGFQIKIARPLEGLDFNRNFPFEWRSEGEQRGSGPYPASEPEIKAAVDFITSHLNINIALTYHTFSRVILRPYSTRADDSFEASDLWVFKKIGEIGTRLTGYNCLSTFHDFKYHPKEITTGAFDDWVFDQLGIFSYTIEQWDLPTEAGIANRKPIEWYRDHPHEEDLQILKWVDGHCPGGYVDWYPFKHPQLGDVELGGWDHMYTWRNPPHGFLLAEAQRNIPFALAAADLLPHLVIHQLKVTALGNDDYLITLIVDNTGFLPTTTSAQGKKRQAVRPVRAQLEKAEGLTLVSEKWLVEIGHLEGRSNKLDVATIWEGSPTDHRGRADWVVHTSPGTEAEISVISERAGSIHTKFRLEAKS